jgi:hypothetical protein
MNYRQSPVTEALVRLNVEHTARIRQNARIIAAGEGLDSFLLELAAALHDVAKLDHRETAAGGIDTWHHHYRGAALARKLVLTHLGLDACSADTVSAAIETHSDIPFIRHFWRSVYHSPLPAPRSPVQLALRDADVIDMLWVGGMAKIVRLRQVPGSDFYRQDRGDIQNAIASARRSFDESAAVLHSCTARHVAARRITTVADFFQRVRAVATIEQFDGIYDGFLAELKTASAIASAQTSCAQGPPIPT